MKVRHIRRQHLQHCPQALAITQHNRERKLQRRSTKRFLGSYGLSPFWTPSAGGDSRRQMFAGNDSSSRLQMFAQQLQRDPIVVELQPAGDGYQYGRENQLTYTRYSTADEDGVLLNPVVAQVFNFQTFKARMTDCWSGMGPIVQR